MTYSVGIITISDSVFAGLATDTSGRALAELVTQRNFRIQRVTTVPDEIKIIQETLVEFSDHECCNLILTTGGTGLSPRDVTPEATKAILEREAPGIIMQILMESLKITPLAVCSRGVAGTRKSSLIVNLPGSQKASTECFSFIASALPHALNVLLDKKSQVLSSHQRIAHVGSSSSCRHSHVSERLRSSPFPMISVQEAYKLVLEQCFVSTKTVRMSSQESLGYVLAEDVFAKDSLPPFPASIKDGYAVLYTDGAGPRFVVGNVDAGNAPTFQTPLQSGKCFRINTGAPVPIGANAVVQIEDTECLEVKNGEEIQIDIKVAPLENQDIRSRGSDIQIGEKVLEKGCVLELGELGILAAVGQEVISVIQKPRVALLSTGNEVSEPFEPLQPGRIRDSNKTVLRALCEEAKVKAIDLGIASDEFYALVDKLKQGLEAADVIVTTGGVSMGDKDIIREVLLSCHFNAVLHFARVKMKPGKPTSFFTLNYNHQKKIVLSLPGNPVSATVTAILYLLPALRKMSGMTKINNAIVKAFLPQDMILDPRPEYVRVTVRLDGSSAQANISIMGNQISSRLLSMTSGTNGLLLLPPGSSEKTTLSKGTLVDVMIFGRLEYAS